MLPEPPRFEDSEWDRFSSDRDWLRPTFELCRHVGLLAIHLSTIGPRTPGVIEHPELEYAVIRGLINRCSRLILAAVKLAAERKHGEVIAALTRCICESAIKACWLMKRNEPGLFKRYMADGLRADLRLHDQVKSRITDRGGRDWIVEDRMLKSIAQCIELAGMTEDEVRSSKPLHDFFSICRDLDLPPEGYIAIQSMGSHTIHGSWTDLLFHYLEVDGGTFEIRDNNVQPHVNYLAVVSLEVLRTLKEYIAFSVANEASCGELAGVCDRTEKEILKVFRASVSDDYEERA